MMHGNMTPEDPPPGNPSSLPGWNSQWSLEHQQFYYVNTSTGERRWCLPNITMPPQTVHVRPEPPTPTTTSAPTQKIQRKIVEAQSIGSNHASPVSALQNAEANTGSGRVPLPQATDSYFPLSSVPGLYQAPQVAQHLAPAPTQNQEPQRPQGAQNPYQQLDFTSHFASLSLEHSQPSSANTPGVSLAQLQPSQQIQQTQTAQSPLSTTDVPISPMSNQPNAQNFSSQPSASYFPPAPAPAQYQSFPGTQSPDQLAFTGNNFASPNSQPNMTNSPLPAPQPVLQRGPLPPPPPRNPAQYQCQPQQVVGQNFTSPGNVQANVSNVNYSEPHLTASPSPVIYHQQQSNFTPPPPPPGSLQQTQQSSTYQQTTSPVQQQYAPPSHSPAVAQYSFPPPPPPDGQQQYQGSEVVRQVSPAAHHQNTSQGQNQRASPRSIPTPTQASTFPLPPGVPQQQQENHAVSPPTQYAASPEQTASYEQSNTTNPTPPPLQHYPTAPIPAHGPYQPPSQIHLPPSAPPLHRYSSAPEPAVHQGNIHPQSGYAQSPVPAKNPYAQQVAHTNSFYGPPPQRVRTQSNTVPQRMPVPQPQSQAQPHVQGSTPQPPAGNCQAHESNFAQAAQQQYQGQRQVQYQAPNQTQYQQPGQFQQQQFSFPPPPQQHPQPHQTHPQPKYQAQYQAQGPPRAPSSAPPLLPPRKSSSGVMGSIGKKFNDFSKTAADKSKRFSVSQPGLKKWGTRAAVGVVAVGALALGVDAISDGSLFDAAGADGGDFSGGDFGAGDDAAFESGGGDFGGGDGDFGGGDAGAFGDGGGYEGGQSFMDAQMEAQAVMNLNAANAAAMDSLNSTLI